MASGTVIVPIPPVSDGDPLHVPSDGWQLVDPPYIYLNKLAEKWMEARGIAKPGVKYYLDRLPNGYRLYQRPRPLNANTFDKHLYGHPGPRRRVFDSPNRFYPHFEHLMNNNGSNIGCPCTVCKPSPAVSSAPRIAVVIPKPVSNQMASHYRADYEQFDRATPPQPNVWQPRVDEEDTPDAIRRLLDNLKLGPVDQDIIEPLSLDWRASKKTLDKWITHMKRQPSWMPRPGEIVLFVRDLQGNEIGFDNTTGTFKLFNEQKCQFVGAPSWEAGVIGQAPSEPVSLEEITLETDKSQSIAYSGFRVEPLSDPNANDKALSKRYKYVHLRQIRPFAFWQEYLKDISEPEWHPTIQNAQKVSSSIVLVDKYRFRGVWPEATIFCRGIYIGSELICAEDTVRIVPSHGQAVTEYLEVASIKLKLTNLDKASDNDYDDGHPYNSTVVISGKAFTSDPTRAWNGFDLASTRPLPKGMDGFEPESLYWLHDPAKTYQVSFSRVLGRCFDASALLMWFPGAASETPLTCVLNYGLSGVQEARQFSSENDTRILPGKTWYWGDSRLDVLGAEALNGVHSSYFDTLREEKLEEWHDAAKLLARHDPAAKDELSSVSRNRPGRPSKKGRNSIMATAAAHAVGASDPEHDDDGVAVRTEDEALRTEDDEALGTEDNELSPGDDEPMTETETLTPEASNIDIPRKRSHSVAEAEAERADLARRFGFAADSPGQSNDDDASSSTSETATLEGESSSAALLQAFKKPRVQVVID